MKKDLKRASSYCLSGSEGYTTFLIPVHSGVSSKASQLLQSSPPVWKKQVDRDKPAVRLTAAEEVPYASTQEGTRQNLGLQHRPVDAWEKGGTPTG